MNCHKANIENINTEVQAFQTATEDAAINEHTITNFTESLASAIIKNTRTTTHNFFSHRLPPHIMRLIKTKRRMYRKYRETLYSDLKPAMNRLNKVIQILILQFRTDCWIKACEDIHEQKGKKYWQTVKKLAGYNSNPPAAGVMVYGVHIQENINKAGVFALHFKKVFSKSEEAQYDDVNLGLVDDRCHQFFTDTDHQHPEPPPITHSELSDIIGKGKNTAPGNDKIPMSILKRLD